MNGKGTFTWPNGNFYSGDFVDDIKHGYGLFSWNNGRKYKG